MLGTLIKLVLLDETDNGACFSESYSFWNYSSYFYSSYSFSMPFSFKRNVYVFYVEVANSFVFT